MASGFLVCCWFDPDQSDRAMRLDREICDLLCIGDLAQALVTSQSWIVSKNCTINWSKIPKQGHMVLALFVLLCPQFSSRIKRKRSVNKAAALSLLSFVLSLWARIQRSSMGRSFLKILLEVFLFIIHTLILIRDLILLFHWSYPPMPEQISRGLLCRKLLALKDGSGEIKTSLFILDFIIWESGEKRGLPVSNSMRNVVLLRSCLVLLWSLVKSLVSLFQALILLRGSTNGLQVFTPNPPLCLPRNR